MSNQIKSISGTVVTEDGKVWRIVDYLSNTNGVQTVMVEPRHHCHPIIEPLPEREQVKAAEVRHVDGFVGLSVHKFRELAGAIATALNGDTEPLREAAAPFMEPVKRERYTLGERTEILDGGEYMAEARTIDGANQIAKALNALDDKGGE